MSTSDYGPEVLSTEAFDFLFLLQKQAHDRVQDVCIYDPNTVFVLTHRRRSQPGFDPIFRSVIHGFYHGQVRRESYAFTMQGQPVETHRHYLKGVGEVRKQEMGGQHSFKVSLINEENNSNLVESFCFLPPRENPPFPEVSTNEKRLLQMAIADKREDVRRELYESWSEKPEMPAAQDSYSNNNRKQPFDLRSHQPFIQPEVSDAMVLRTGVAAFLSLDQVDAEDSTPIMRHQVWLLTSNHIQLGCDPVRFKTVARAGYDYIRFVTANPDRAIIMTFKGKGRLPL